MVLQLGCTSNHNNIDISPNFLYMSNEFAYVLVLIPHFVQVSFHNLVLENLLYTYLTKILV